MNTIEDFENAPIGSTAIRPDGTRAIDVDGPGDPCLWITTEGDWLNPSDMAKQGFALNPVAPTTAREAFDLAWELGHPVKEGQVIPEGTKWMKRAAGKVHEYIMSRDYTVTANDTYIIRTHELLPEPEPDWLDAPAVLATTTPEDRTVFVRGDKTGTQKPHDGNWQSARTGLHYRWRALTDVTPLWPEGQEA